MDKLTKKYTKDHTEIPLFMSHFNLQKYRENGVKGSCLLRIHPNLKGDEHVAKQLNDLVDYIRENYNMEDLI